MWEPNCFDFDCSDFDHVDLDFYCSDVDLLDFDHSDFYFFDSFDLDLPFVQLLPPGWSQMSYQEWKLSLLLQLGVLGEVPRLDWSQKLGQL